MSNPHRRRPGRFRRHGPPRPRGASASRHPFDLYQRSQTPPAYSLPGMIHTPANPEYYPQCPLRSVQPDFRNRDREPYHHPSDFQHQRPYASTHGAHQHYPLHGASDFRLEQRPPPHSFPMHEEVPKGNTAFQPFPQYQGIPPCPSSSSQENSLYTKSSSDSPYPSTPGNQSYSVAQVVTSTSSASKVSFAQKIQETSSTLHVGHELTSSSRIRPCGSITDYCRDAQFNPKDTVQPQENTSVTTVKHAAARTQGQDSATVNPSKSPATSEDVTGPLHELQLVNKKSGESYTAEEKFFLRLFSINVNVSKKVLHKVFCKGHKNFFEKLSQRGDMTLFDHYEEKGINVKKFRKNLNDNQIQTIERDPRGMVFDVTLLFLCIQYGNDDVEHKDLGKWKEGRESLESLLTFVKNNRNRIVHNEHRCSSQQFIEEINKLIRILTDVLNLAGSRYGIPVAEVKQEIEEMVHEVHSFRDRPFVAQEFEEYKKELIYEVLSDLINTEGKEDVYKQYESRYERIITPVYHMGDINFHVGDIFTRMILQNAAKTGPRSEVKTEDILYYEAASKDNYIILLEGIAGVGKTTLSKKILHDWMLPEGSTIKCLDEFDLLLHSECRNRSIRSFTSLLRGLMPTVSQSFKEEDLKYVTLSLKVLVLLDGLDELNESSAQLFQEILDLKFNYGMQVHVIVTTRPEKLEYFYRNVNMLKIKVKHIELIGIPQHKRDEFVCRYHREMNKVNAMIPAIDGLLTYLKRTGDRLRDLWMLPYNLTLLVILWVHNSSAVNTVTTSTELYWQIHLLCLLKLKERLGRHEGFSLLDEGCLKENTEYFIGILSREALIGLVNDNISLTEESYKHLQNVCHGKKLPPDEMIGAFLKKLISKTFFGYDVTYSFPHKGIQDFLGALSIFKEIENRSQTDATESSAIRDLLEKLNGSKPLIMAKFQNLLSILIGIIHLKPNRIEVENIYKKEVLNLLQKTGIRHGKNWLQILDSVKCDEFVADYISHLPGVLDSLIVIDGISIFAYIRLFESLQESPDRHHSGYIEVELFEVAGLKELLENVLRLQLHVSSLSLELYYEMLTPDLPYENAITEVLRHCDVAEYKGPLNKDMTFPKSLRQLYVTVRNWKDYKALANFLASGHQLSSLEVCLKSDIDSSVLEPLPCLKDCFSQPAVQIVGIDTEATVQNACNMVRRLQLVDSEKCLKELRFRDTKPDSGLIEMLVRGLEGVRVTSLYIPSVEYPSRKKALVSLAKELLEVSNVS